MFTEKLFLQVAETKFATLKLKDFLKRKTSRENLFLKLLIKAKLQNSAKIELFRFQKKKRILH